MGNLTAPVTASTPPGNAYCDGVIGSVGKRFAQYVVVDGEFATAPFLHTAGELGLRVVARLERQFAGVTRCRTAAFSFWASHHGFSARSRSRGGVGRGGLRSLGNARLGHRARLLLSPAQTATAR